LAVCGGADYAEGDDELVIEVRYDVVDVDGNKEV
tara:strand:+ start:1022 stop:1123 length:102 start_codon:yes stop_codon:yes gene_type:complete